MRSNNIKRIEIIPKITAHTGDVKPINLPFGFVDRYSSIANKHSAYIAM
jgi:hypothetical protein